MEDSIRKFKPRAFRYVLRPQDKTAMRFSLEHTTGSAHIEQTFLINMSESGVAFLIDPGTQVHIKERLKVEIPVPSGESIAWWGTVVRIQEYEPRSWFGRDRFREDKKIMVAVRFDELPDGHSRAIRKGIEQSFMKAMREQQYRNWLYYRVLVLQNIGKFLLYILLFAAAIGFIWYFSLPSDNYDAKRGAPWGERFK
ncbi:MAG: PilZ domain-containing protein [Bdellovibrionales bacterium]|nr:PilZ domain-containing protein [Bdellovibrionales bacterium]